MVSFCDLASPPAIPQNLASEIALHIAAHGIAMPSQDLHAVKGSVHKAPRGMHFSCRRFSGAGPSLRGQPSGLVGEKTGGVDPNLHIGEHVLGCLRGASVLPAIADGVIVGSRLIQLIEEDTTLSSLKAFVSSLRLALD